MDILERLSEIHELPTLPEMAMKIRKMVISTDGNAAALAGIIEQDPALAAKVLKVANSSFYGPRTPINTVQRAVAHVGFNEIGNLAMAVSFIKNFSKKSSTLDHRRFWKHSLAAAYLSESFMQYNHKKQDQQSGFIAGLLHDIGILIYEQFFHEEFDTFNSYAANAHVSYIEAEQHLSMNAPHGVLGAALLSRWKIDECIQKSVAEHHLPLHCNPPEVTTLSGATWLAEYILCTVAKNSFEGTYANENAIRFNCIALSKEAFEEHCTKALECITRADEVLDI